MEVSALSRGSDAEDQKEMVPTGCLVVQWGGIPPEPGTAAALLQLPEVRGECAGQI